MEKGTQRRVFDLDLKLDLVRQIERGELTQGEVSRLYSVSVQAVRKWLFKYSDLYKNQTRVVVEKRSVSKKNQELRDRVKELEQSLGQKQMRVDYLEKLLEVASERLGEDIEKKTKRLL